MFSEINPGLRELSLSNTLLIDDYPYMSVGNVPFSYIIPQPFDQEVEDNYLLANLWPYLLGLLKAPSTLKYIGYNPHGQQWITRKHPHWFAIKAFALSFAFA